MSGAPTPQNPPNILVVTSAAAEHDQLLETLRGLGEVHTVASVDQALAALRTGRFDVVLSRPTELVALARPEARQRAELILDRIGQGVCIVDRNGALVWGNAKLHSYPELVIETVRQHCAEQCAELVVGHTPASPSPSRRRTIRVGQEYVFDLTVAPLLTAARQVEEVVGLVLDITATCRLQEGINAIEAAGRELVRLDAGAAGELDVGERLKLLEGKIIRCAHDLLHFDHFVVRVLDPKTNRLETVMASGVPEEAKTIPVRATAEGNGICGYVAATGRSYICPDVKQDPRYLPGLDRPGSSLTVPLRLHDQVVGVLNVESHEVGAFTEDDRQFSEIFGHYIGVALHILKLLAVERSTATSQITSEVAAELANPLNDIVTQATNTIQSHADQEDLRRSLGAIIDNVDRVKRSLHTLTETPGLTGLVPESGSRYPLLDGKRILVADDENIICETIADVLSKAGALAVTASDGQAAVAMINTQHFDLVVTDINMPYKNGYEVFAAARQANPNCPVILITGFSYDPEHSILRASRKGLAGTLFKPFKVETLVDTVHRALLEHAT